MTKKISLSVVVIIIAVLVVFISYFIPGYSKTVEASDQIKMILDNKELFDELIVDGKTLVAATDWNENGRIEILAKSTDDDVLSIWEINEEYDAIEVYESTKEPEHCELSYDGYATDNQNCMTATYSWADGSFAIGYLWLGGNNTLVYSETAQKSLKEGDTAVYTDNQGNYISEGEYYDSIKNYFDDEHPIKFNISWFDITDETDLSKALENSFDNFSLTP